MQELPFDLPKYSIRVTAHLTGISADQLCVWERRYGFPSPGRNEAGARCYVQADIERLQLIARPLRSGWRARDVVQAPQSELQRLLALVSPLASHATNPMSTACATN